MSIRLRLTVWYVLLLATVLIIFSLAFYTTLQYSLTSEIDRTLQERAQQVILKIKAENNPLDIFLSGTISLPALDVFSSQSIFIQIANTRGKVIKTSPNLQEYHLPINAEILTTINHQQSSLTTFMVGQIPLRLYSIPLLLGNDSTIGMVQVGQPLTDVQTTLNRVLIFLIIGIALALLMATLFGALLAHLSLRPIDRITSTANQIVSGTDLQQRLPVSHYNDELDRLSSTINEMLARLDNFFQAQVRLSADISHELRTPLTIIRGNVDILHHSDELPEERREAFSAIDSALDRMSRLVSDLLLLSQADAGMTLSMRPLQLDAVILDVFQQAQTLRNGVNLKLGRADEATIYGDTDRLKQLLLNLLHNAFKHTPPDGSVTLSVFDEEDHVRICVADTGEGIAPEHLPYIFDRFYRVKNQQRKGAGLGLAIARWIAEAHGGSLTAESKPGIGSTFTLRLPKQKVGAIRSPITINN